MPLKSHAILLKEARRACSVGLARRAPMRDVAVLCVTAPEV